MTKLNLTVGSVFEDDNENIFTVVRLDNGKIGLSEDGDIMDEEVYSFDTVEDIIRMYDEEPANSIVEIKSQPPEDVFQSLRKQMKYEAGKEWEEVFEDLTFDLYGVSAITAEIAHWEPETLLDDEQGNHDLITALDLHIRGDYYDGGLHQLIEHFGIDEWREEHDSLL